MSNIEHHCASNIVHQTQRVEASEVEFVFLLFANGQANASQCKLMHRMQIQRIALREY